MATLDDLLAARAAAAPASAPSIDDMLAHRAAGGTIPVAAVPDPGFWSKAAGQVSDAGSAFVHHVANFPHGIAQLVENAASGAVNAVAPSSSLGRYVTQVVDSDNAGLAQREADYQKSTPNSAGAYTGAAVGGVLPLLVGGVGGGLQKLGDFAAAKLLPEAAPKLASKVVSGATQGAVVGAAEPATQSANLSDLVTGQQAPDFWSQKAAQVGAGALTGGALPVLAAPVRAVANALAPVVNPKSVVAPLMNKLTNGDQALVDALQNPKQIVPGSMPTTAQVLATPEAVATEKAFANTNPDFKNQLVARQNANNDARISAIQGVAQTPDAIAAALQDRTATTQPLIDSLLTNGKPVDAQPIIDQLNTLKASSLGTDPVVKKAATDLLSSIQDGVTNTGQGGTLVRPDLLDGYRQNVRNFLQQNSSTGAVATRQEAAFEPVRSAIVDSIDGANPGYRDYLATYAAKSQPVNTMEAGGSILDSVAGDSRSANSSGAPQVTLSRYSSALAKALSGPYQIAPEARATLEGVQQDLQRESISNSIRSPGSDTAYNLQAPNWLASQLYGDSFSGSPGAAKTVGGLAGAVGGYLGGGAGGASGGAFAGYQGMNKLGQFGQSRVNDIMARALTDPEFAAQLAAQAQPSAPSALLQAVPQLGLLQ